MIQSDYTNCRATGGSKVHTHTHTRTHVCILSRFGSCLTLTDSCYSPVDCSPPASSVHGILQARILEWVATPSFRGSSRPRDRTCISYVSCIGRQVLTTGATWEALHTNTHTHTHTQLSNSEISNSPFCR